MLKNEFVRKNDQFSQSIFIHYIHTDSIKPLLASELRLLSTSIFLRYLYSTDFTLLNLEKSFHEESGVILFPSWIFSSELLNFWIQEENDLSTT